MDLKLDPGKMQPIPGAIPDLRTGTLDNRVRDANLYGQDQAASLYNQRRNALGGAIQQLGGGLPDIANRIGR